MNVKKTEAGDTKPGSAVWITAVVVVVSLIIVALVLASRNINFADLMIKLHGG